MDSLPSFNRVSVRAVLVQQGEDPGPRLSAAGIYDPITVPVLVDQDQSHSGVILGDGFTRNLTAVLETEAESSPGAAADTQPGTGRGDAGSTQSGSTQSGWPGTTMLPAAFGSQPLAPVRQRNT